MNPPSASPAAGAPIPDFPFREPETTKSQPSDAEAKTSPIPETPVSATSVTLDELRQNLNQAVQAALQQFHAYVDAVLAVAPQNTRLTAPWSLPEGLPQEPFPDLEPLPERGNYPQVQLDASFKEKLDQALAQAFAEPAKPVVKTAPEFTPIAAKTPVQPTAPSGAGSPRKAVLPPPRHPAPNPAPSPPVVATPLVAVAVEKASPFTVHTEASEEAPLTPFVIASAAATPPPPAPPKESPSPFSVVAPAAIPAKPTEPAAAPQSPATSPFQTPFAASEVFSEQTEELPLPPADNRPASPFNPPFTTPGTSPAVSASEPSVPIPPLAVETPSPLPFSPFQGLEPAPPPPLLDRVNQDTERPAFQPAISAPGMTFEAPPAAPATAVLEPAPPVIRASAPPVVPPTPLPPSRVTSPVESSTSSEGIGFSFAELLKANGQAPH